MQAQEGDVHYSSWFDVQDPLEAEAPLGCNTPERTHLSDR